MFLCRFFAISFRGFFACRFFASGCFCVDSVVVGFRTDVLCKFFCDEFPRECFLSGKHEI